MEVISIRVGKLEVAGTWKRILVVTGLIFIKGNGLS